MHVRSYSASSQTVVRLSQLSSSVSSCSTAGTIGLNLTAGTPFAQAIRMLIASIDVWSDPREDRACRVNVYEDTCMLVLEAHGQRVLMSNYPSVAAAMDTAAAYRRECSTTD